MLAILASGSGLSPLLSLLLLILISIAAGAMGSMLGLGGGLIIVPALVVLFGVDIQFAVAASLVSVIATSSGASASSLEHGQTNLRLGMFLESATAVGGLAGAALVVVVFAHHGMLLILAFVPVVLIAAYWMFTSRRSDVRPDPAPDRWARRLGLDGEYTDEHTGLRVHYAVTRTRAGLVLSGLAGVSAGLFGIGGGLFKVPAMSTVMNVPIRVAAATSTFMIGVTATAGALVYLFAGEVNLSLAAPVVLGVLVGTIPGTRLQASSSSRRLRTVFAGILVLAAFSMVLQAAGLL